MTQTIEQLTARVRELEEDRNQWMANSRENKLIAEQCNRDLAASQLHAAQLRKHIALALEFCNIPAFDVSETLATALSLPADTSALDAYVAEKVKEATTFGKSKDIHALAEIVVSDCGCSSTHWPLMNKVENRLWQFFDNELATLTRQRDLAVAALEFISKAPFMEQDAHTIRVKEKAIQTLSAIKQSSK